MSGAVAMPWCLTAARGSQVALPPGGRSVWDHRSAHVAVIASGDSPDKRMGTGLFGTV